MNSDNLCCHTFHKHLEGKILYTYIGEMIVVTLSIIRGKIAREHVSCEFFVGVSLIPVGNGLQFPGTILGEIDKSLLTLTVSKMT